MISFDKKNKKTQISVQKNTYICHKKMTPYFKTNSNTKIANIYFTIHVFRQTTLKLAQPAMHLNLPSLMGIAAQVVFMPMKQNTTAPR